MVRHFFTACIASACTFAYAQQPVILTDNARTLGGGTLELGLGSEYLEKSTAPEQGTPVKLRRFGRLAAHFGVSSNVDFSADWKGGLVGTYADGRTDSDWGDLTVTTKIGVVGGDTTGFSLALRSSVKLPNTSRLPHKLGSDATDYYFQIILSHATAVLELRAAIGFGIIGSPRTSNSQDDIYTFGGAALYPSGGALRTFVELSGFVSSLEVNNKVVARGGCAMTILGVQLHVYGSARIAGSARDYGTAFELTESWGIGGLLLYTIHF